MRIAMISAATAVLGFSAQAAPEPNLEDLPAFEVSRTLTTTSLRHPVVESDFCQVRLIVELNIPQSQRLGDQTTQSGGYPVACLSR